MFGTATLGQVRALPGSPASYSDLIVAPACIGLLGARSENNKRLRVIQPGGFQLTLKTRKVPTEI